MNMKNTARPKAAICGCISIDICPGFINDPKDPLSAPSDYDFSRIIKPGAITRILPGGLYPGGSVANTGLAMNLFGIDPIFCCKIGDDEFGKMLKSMIHQQMGTDSRTEPAFSGIVTARTAPTAYSIILAPNGLDRAILQNPGANDEFGFADLDFPSMAESGCKLFHFGHPPSLRKTYENNGEELKKMFIAAHQHGMAVSLDLCAVDPQSLAGKQNWRTILEEVLPHVDFFVPSIDELADMLGETEFETKARASHLAAISRQLGAKNILIKCGAHGMYYRNADEEDIKEIEPFLGPMDTWPGKEGFAPGKSIAELVPGGCEVSGLGAGDTSIGAYLAAALRGMSFEDALEAALTEGALCVTQDSATGGLIPLESIPTLQTVSGQ